MRLDVLKAMNAARRARRAGAIVTRLSDGDQRFVAAEAVGADPLAAELEAALRMGKSGAVDRPGRGIFPHRSGARAAARDWSARCISRKRSPRSRA